MKPASASKNIWNSCLRAFLKIDSAICTPRFAKNLSQIGDKFFAGCEAHLTKSIVMRSRYFSQNCRSLKTTFSTLHTSKLSHSLGNSS